MIITSCPYCDAPLWVPITDNPDMLRKWTKEQCEACGLFCYVQHSRIDGKTYSSEAFEAAGGKRITPEPQP